MIHVATRCHNIDQHHLDNLMPIGSSSRNSFQQNLKIIGAVYKMGAMQMRRIHFTTNIRGQW